MQKPRTFGFLLVLGALTLRPGDAGAGGLFGLFPMPRRPAAQPQAAAANPYQSEAEANQLRQYGRPEDAADPHGAQVQAEAQAGAAQGAAFAKQVIDAYGFDKDAGAMKALAAILSPQGGRPPPSAGALLAMAHYLPGAKYVKYAERVLLRSIELEHSNPDAYRELARICADRFDWAGAADAQHSADQSSSVPDEVGQIRLLAYLAMAFHLEGLDQAAGMVVDDPATQLVTMEEFKNLRKVLRGQKFEWGVVLDPAPGGAPGVVIRSVVAASAADAAALQAGDRLEKVGGTRPLDVNAAVAALQAVPLGSEVTFVVRRGGNLVPLTGRKAGDAGRKLAEKLNAEGVERAKARDFAGAMERFEKAIAADPRFGKSWYNVGLVKDGQRDGPGAFAAYLSALALGLDPEVARKVRSRADELQGSIGDPDGAFPEEARRRCEQGMQYAQQERYAGGLFAFLRALQASPGYPNALLGTATLEAAVGMRAASLQDFAAYLAVLPGAPNRQVVEEQMRALQSQPPLTPIPVGPATSNAALAPGPGRGINLGGGTLKGTAPATRRGGGMSLFGPLFGR